MTADAPSGGPGRLEPGEARRITGRITRWSVAVAAILVILKAGAFAVSGSVAMLASLLDSALDLAASLTTFFAVRYAVSPADAEHRYGHGKVEALASLLQAVLVAASAGFLMREAWMRFFDPRPLEAGGAAIAVMVISTVLTLVLVRAQTRAMHATGSLAVTGDRAHYLSDLGANGAVIAALILAAAGLERADPLIAFGVALWLIWTAFDVGRRAYENLIDRELPEADREKILALTADDPRVLGVHHLRTRASGPFIHIQCHMDLDPDLTLTGAHEILVAAERRVLSAYPSADVLIHPDPKGRAERHGLEHFSAPDEAAKPPSDEKPLK